MSLPGAVSTLIQPWVCPSVMARSSSARLYRVTSKGTACARASASLSPTRPTSGSVKVTAGMAWLSNRTRQAHPNNAFTVACHA